jgi:hypothetical protein
MTFGIARKTRFRYNSSVLPGRESPLPKGGSFFMRAGKEGLPFNQRKSSRFFAC